MVYVDTGVVVALIVPETHSAAVARWYARSRADLVSAFRCVAEFASALSTRQRAGQLDAAQAEAAWQRFLRLATNDLAPLPLAAPEKHLLAGLSLDATNALRAGDPLHLASATQAGAKSMATLDAVLGRNARRLKMKLVPFA